MPNLPTTRPRRTSVSQRNPIIVSYLFVRVWNNPPYNIIVIVFHSGVLAFQVLGDFAYNVLYIYVMKLYITSL